MRHIAIGFLAIIFLMSGCDNKPKVDYGLEEDYQRIEADWLTEQEARLRQQTVKNIQYILQIDLTKSERYSGIVEIQFDYTPSPYPLTIDFVGGEAEKINVNSRTIGIEYNGNFIIIPSNKLDAGRNIVKIQYSNAYSDNGSGLYRYTDPTDNKVYLYTHFEPYDANKLFPSFDQPNLRANYKLKVVAPKEWTVVSSVRESEVITDGPYKRWSFPQSPNFSTYIFPLHAGPWHIWEGTSGKTPLRLMTRQSLAKLIDVREWLQITQQGFDFYENYFNIDYPYSKYDQLLVPDFNIGGMENVAAVTFTENYIPRGIATNARKRQIANTILHELSHMWFGNLVTIDWWSELWLKESFASYMAPLALSKSTKYKGAWRAFYSKTKQGAYQADKSVTTHPINMTVLDTKSGDASFDSITYNKGAAVLQQLSHFLGKNEFRDGIRVYLKSHKNEAAQQSDFIAALEKVSDSNLKLWSSNWLNTAGVNTINVNYQCSHGKITEFSIIQSTTIDYSRLREHKIQLALYQNVEDKIVATTVEQILVRDEVTPVDQFYNLPCPLLVYPNHGDWGYLNVQLDKKSLLLLPDNINRIEDPLSRSMFWQSLWDMVRDLEMPVTDYLKLALQTISSEKDPEILSQVLSNLSESSHWIYASSVVNSKATSLLNELEQLMLKAIQLEEEDSELQKIWFKQFTDLAHSDISMDYLSGWLQDENEPKILATNQDRRWQAIIALSSASYSDSTELIELEEIRDSSDKGSMMALAARASQPQIEIKQYWLDELMRNENRQTAARLKQAMSYLFPSGQSQLHGVFAEKILSDLHYLDANKGQELIATLVDTILPASCSEISVKLLKDAQSNVSQLGLIAQKGIKIAHQEDQRCVAIKQLISSK